MRRARHVLAAAVVLAVITPVLPRTPDERAAYLRCQFDRCPPAPAEDPAPETYCMIEPWLCVPPSAPPPDPD
jgi:hypothetical protein